MTPIMYPKTKVGSKALTRFQVYSQARREALLARYSSFFDCFHDVLLGNNQLLM